MFTIKGFRPLHEIFKFSQPKLLMVLSIGSFEKGEASRVAPKLKDHAKAKDASGMMFGCSMVIPFGEQVLICGGVSHRWSDGSKMVLKDLMC